jgi:hypothetical protein
MASLEHDDTARVTEIHIRQQLFNGGNFYWGKWSNDGKDLEAVECLGAARVALDNKVGLKCKFISLWDEYCLILLKAASDFPMDPYGCGTWD